MGLSAILTTLCFITISRLSTVQSADLTNTGSGTYTCSGDCNIICSDDNGCDGAVFHIENTVPVWVNCTAIYACRDVTFRYAGSAYVEHVCDSQDACPDSTMIVFNPMHLNCKDGSYACSGVQVVDFVPPASGQVTITISGTLQYFAITVFSFYHQGQILYCINAPCDWDDVHIYYGLKFDEYCLADDSSCISTQSAIADDVYGSYTLVDTLSGTYGTDYDFSSYTMYTNVVFVLVGPDKSTFYPPTMYYSTSIVSVICKECSWQTFDFSSANHAVLTGAKLYATQGATVHGSSETFMVNSYITMSIYDTTFYLDSYDDVAITINALQNYDNTNPVYLGTNVDVDVNCYGPRGRYTECIKVFLRSEVDPNSADFSKFQVDCSSSSCSGGVYANFPTYAPSLTCTFTESAGVSAGCEFFDALDATRSPTATTTVSPSEDPTKQPTDPTVVPTIAPSQSTNAPSSDPTRTPSSSPTFPTQVPSNMPSRNPTNAPIAPTSDTTSPTSAPSGSPTSPPSLAPSLAPSSAPSLAPSLTPSLAPSSPPSLAPSLAPSSAPSLTPSSPPSLAPSLAPSSAPSLTPTLAPSNSPTATPSQPPTIAPTNAPTIKPTHAPVAAPSASPTLSPTAKPSVSPTRFPTAEDEYTKMKLVIFEFEKFNNYDKNIISPKGINGTIVNQMMAMIEGVYVSVSATRAAIAGTNGSLEYRQFHLVQNVDDVELTEITFVEHDATFTSELHYELENTSDAIAFLSNDLLFRTTLLNKTAVFFYQRYHQDVNVRLNDSDLTLKSVEVTEIPVIEPETDYVFVSLVVFLCVMFSISIAAKWFNGRDESKVDNADWMAPGVFGLQIFDLITDMNLAYEILGRIADMKSEDSEEGSDTTLLVLSGIGCTMFVVIPWLLNIFFAIRVTSWVEYNKKAVPYFESRAALFIILVLFSGATYPTLMLLSSRIFGLDPFNAGLTAYELRIELFWLKVVGNVALENFPQLICQIMYMVYNGGASKTIMLSFTASFLSIAVSLLFFFVEKARGKGKTKKPRYDLMMKPTRSLTDDDIATFHRKKGRKGELGDELCRALECHEGMLEIGAWTGGGARKRLHIIDYHSNDIDAIKGEYKDNMERIERVFNSHFESIADEPLYRIEFIEEWRASNRKDDDDDDDDYAYDEKKEHKIDSDKGNDIPMKVIQSKDDKMKQKKAKLLDERYWKAKEIIYEISKMKNAEMSKHGMQQRLLNNPKYPQKLSKAILAAFKISDTTPQGATTSGHKAEENDVMPSTTPGGE
eukprot:647282_1